MITRARIPSFIATLAVSSLLTAAIAWISGSQQIVNLPAGFATIGTGQLFGLTYPVLHHARRRRRCSGTSWNAPRSAAASTPPAATRTPRPWPVCAPHASSCSPWSPAAWSRGLAGLLVTSQLSAGDPTIGPGYLLPVIAAVFLGSTQFRGGRFNIWGTVVAAYVLAVGVKGLQLAGLPIWIPDLFNGAALLLAVGLAAWRRTPSHAGASCSSSGCSASAPRPGS